MPTRLLLTKIMENLYIYPPKSYLDLLAKTELLEMCLNVTGWSWSIRERLIQICVWMGSIQTSRQISLFRIIFVLWMCAFRLSTDCLQVVYLTKNTKKHQVQKWRKSLLRDLILWQMTSVTQNLALHKICCKLFKRKFYVTNKAVHKIHFVHTFVFFLPDPSPLPSYVLNLNSW